MYLWLYWYYKHRISNMSSLATEVSSKKDLEIQLTCKSCHKMTFSKLLTCWITICTYVPIMLIKFEVGNIPVAKYKFVSRSIVDSFLAHFIITIMISHILRYIPTADHKVIMYIVTTNFHRQLVHEDLHALL